MVYVFEKMKCDGKDIFIVREMSGKTIFASEDANKLVDFYKSLGV